MKAFTNGFTDLGTWRRVPVPFPDQPQDNHPSTSIGTISKIKSMKANGMKVVDSASELHVSPQTVRYYTKENDA